MFDRQKLVEKVMHTLIIRVRKFLSMEEPFLLRSHFE